MTRVTWIGDARVVPGIGLPTKGQSYDVDDALAAQLVEQGMAELVRTPGKSGPKLSGRLPAEDEE